MRSIWASESHNAPPPTGTVYPSTTPPDEGPKFEASAPPPPSKDVLEHERAEAFARASRPPPAHPEPVFSQSSQPSSANVASKPPGTVAMQPRKSRPWPLHLLVLPPRMAHAVFAIASKAVLAPARAAFGQQIPYSGRKHLVLLPEGLEGFMGHMSFLQAKATSKVLHARHRDSQLVERVGRRIIQALPSSDDPVPGYLKHLAKFTWEFAVIQDRAAVNACVHPGGKVVVYTGLLDLIKRDEDKLATILGHEAAHVLARHSAEGVGLNMLLAGVGWAACRLLKILMLRSPERIRDARLAQKIEQLNKQYQPGSPKHALAVAEVKAQYAQQLQDDNRSQEQLGQLVDSGVQLLLNLLVNLPNSRRAETEADIVGLKLTAKAGYNFMRAPEVWDDFVKKEPQFGQLSLLSTHPPSLERKEVLQRQIDKMKQAAWSA